MKLCFVALLYLFCLPLVTATISLCGPDSGVPSVCESEGFDYCRSFTYESVSVRMSFNNYNAVANNAKSNIIRGTYHGPVQFWYDCDGTLYYDTDYYGTPICPLCDVCGCDTTVASGGSAVIADVGSPSIPGFNAVCWKSDGVHWVAIIFDLPPWNRTVVPADYVHETVTVMPVVQQPSKPSSGSGGGSNSIDEYIQNLIPGPAEPPSPPASGEVFVPVKTGGDMWSIPGVDLNGLEDIFGDLIGLVKSWWH